MNKAKIKAALERHLSVDYKIEQLTDSIAPFVGGIDDAAEAIAALPVDRVQAMALFVTDATLGRYYVPDTEMKMHTVDFVRGTRRCHVTKSFTLCSEGDCEHIGAVELHRARQQ